MTAVLITLAPQQARAVPSFATQTGQQCAACHVGAFGPQLKQTGRDFKMYGYINQDEKDHFPPIALTSQTSFTHTNDSQAGGAAPGFKDNNNFAEDQMSVYYAGRITPTTGGFIQATYDGVAKKLTWDNMDIRHAREFGDTGDLVAGVDVNNGPAMEDLWNSTPTWGFPYNSSPLAPTPDAATLIDGGLNESVLGAGVYGMWKQWVYADVTAFGNIPNTLQRDLGNPGVSQADTYDGLLPYGRVALQHEFGQQYFEVGSYAVHADRYPGGVTTAGTDKITDYAFDANYQWHSDDAHFMGRPVDNFISGHSTLIDEHADLTANQALNGTNSSDDLHTFRADVSYSFDDTYTPTVQYFKTWGTSDAALYAASPNGSPDSEGYVAEIGLVPWGKEGSPAFDWFNGRLGLQYVGYKEFDGEREGASANNTVYLSLWIALDPFTPVAK